MQYRQYYHEKRVKDIFFLFVYILATCVFLYYVISYAPNSPIFSGTTPLKVENSIDEVFVQIDTNPGMVLMSTSACSLFAIFASLIYMSIFNSFPLFTVHFTFIVTFLMMIAVGVVKTVNYVEYFWIFFAIAVVVALLYLWCYRRLAFTAIVIQNSLAIVSKYPGIILITLLALFISLKFTTVWFLTATGLHQCSKDIPAGIMWTAVIFLLLYFLWTVQIITNIIHTAICAICGNFYFYTDEERENKGVVSIRMLLRTIAYSLGSVALGSIFVPFTNFLTSALKSKNRQNNDGIVRVMCLCCCGWLARVVETFNSYAFVQVGICGKSFYESAIDTGYLLRERGFNVVTADLVAEEISFVISCFLAGITVLLSSFTFLIEAEYHLRILCILVNLLFTFVVCGMGANMMTSTVMATSVCFSMDPNLFSRRSPECYYRFKDRYAGFLNV